MKLSFVFTISNNDPNFYLLSPFLSPSSDLKSLNANMASVWVKMASSWLSVVLYMWTLVAPAILSNRDFT